MIGGHAEMLNFVVFGFHQWWRRMQKFQAKFSTKFFMQKFREKFSIKFSGEIFNQIFRWFGPRRGIIKVGAVWDRERERGERQKQAATEADNQQ